MISIQTARFKGNNHKIIIIIIINKRVACSQLRMQDHKVIRCEGDLRDVARTMVSEAPFRSPATAHGQRNEPKARSKFEGDRGLKVHQFGLVVAPEDPWLGCPPDGIFRYYSPNLH
ncbi:hypothetical protein HPB47_003099 [Ixodes persulcatus]|uniref:Uncharacterized protein n=1 Tax=Ixodes persulcatus TaxID=34615 RepID=A0AC60PL12_IXOPE|nr:hypothetical protein HPB47_003099 [Ixodes persulcatus]